MELPQQEDSSDNLYYTYQANADFLDLASFEDILPVAQTKRVFWWGYLKSILGGAVAAFSFFLETTWDCLKFCLAYLVFIKQKTVVTARFLDLTKDRSVRFMMWRRGVLFRPATHGGVIALGALAVVAGGIFSRSEIAAQNLVASNSIVAAPNTPETIIPAGRPRSEIIKYTVRGGDTIGAIADKFAISADSVKWASNKDNDTINPGDVLNIPPVTGVIYKVNAGDGLEAVAAKYSADSQTIADYPFNYLDATMSLRAGQMLVIPNGSIPKPVAQPVRRSFPVYLAHGSGILAWPAAGTLNQYASWWHPAIDIGAPYGTPVYAADAGLVTVSQTYDPYGAGQHVVIDHGNGMTTLYAHLSALNVKVGDTVSRRQLLGAVGCSGFCTGPHLHFQATRGGESINPLSLLP